MTDADHRGTLIRVRLSEEDMARVTAIQQYYESKGVLSSMTRVISDCVEGHFSQMVELGIFESDL